MKSVVLVVAGLVAGLCGFTHSPLRAGALFAGDPVDCVNPLSGCNGDAEFSRGNTVAAIVAPFGLTTWAPQTDGEASPFYQMKHSRWEGIRATHQPSIWIRDYGDFLITPVVGSGDGSARDCASPFSHDREIARPYYYSVDLPRHDVRLELVPSERCALMRVAFPDTREAAGKLRHYSPFANGRICDGPLYTDDGLWDTYRAAFPLFVLYYPERSADILEGWLNAYREGGRLPNWPSPGNRPCMIGSHSDSIFADAWVKGVRTFT